MRELTGPDAFIAELTALGLTVERRSGLVVVTLDCGVAGAGGDVEVGTDPPPDFPATPPHWIHLAKGIVLPAEQGRESVLGEAWRRWSRPHPKWRALAAGPAVRQWLAHVHALLQVAKDERS